MRLGQLSLVSSISKSTDKNTITKIMFKFWNKLLRSPEGANPQDALTYESRIRGLELTIAEQRSEIENLRNEIRRTANGEHGKLSAHVDAHFAGVIDFIASPLTQLLTQIHLVEDKGVDIPVAEVFAVIKRLLRSLEKQGVQFFGSIGTEAAFDPSLHEPLSNSDLYSTGRAVLVKAPGIRAKQKMIRKAEVA